MSAWMPIETAPKGKLVVLYHPPTTGRNALAAWYTVDYAPPHYSRKATHWLPVPAPPVLLPRDAQGEPK
jgi:hypothetical protein